MLSGHIMKPYFIFSIIVKLGQTLS